jgi:hypothetical protein
MEFNTAITASYAANRRPFWTRRVFLARDDLPVYRRLDVTGLQRMIFFRISAGACSSVMRPSDTRFFA